MQYLISFLEGVITFISPCLLPMLPVYVSYFAGGGERSTGKTLKASLGFVAGFSLTFIALGTLAGTVGGFLRSHQTAVNVGSGLIVIFFGLNFLGIIRLNLFQRVHVLLEGRVDLRSRTRRLQLLAYRAGKVFVPRFDAACLGIDEYKPGFQKFLLDPIFALAGQFCDSGRADRAKFIQRDSQSVEDASRVRGLGFGKYRPLREDVGL